MSTPHMPPLPRSLLRIRPKLEGLRRQWRYLGPLKLANIALAEIQRILRTESVWGFPYAVTIEPTNLCNSNCRLCPTGQGHAARPKGLLEWDRYREWIDRNARWIHTLGLSFWGDPLLSPDIIRMIGYAHRARIWTCLSTNLHAMRLESGDAAALVGSGLDEMTCSLHAASQATYQAYQPGKDFDATVAKIRELTAARRQCASATPKIILSFVVTRRNEHEISAFQQLARDLECEPKLISPSLNLRFLPPEGREQEAEHRLRNWLPENPRYVKSIYRRLLEGDFRAGDATEPCRMLWSHIYITWDGKILPCSASQDPGEAFGDLAVEGVRRIWNGPHYRAARRQVCGRPAPVVMCAGCEGALL